MLAETPIEMRSRLGLALFALGRLADEVGVQPSPAATVNSLVAGLKDPFLFVVAGEVNAGKSMLLNALFGEEFCPTSALPSTDKIRYFRHGFTRQEIEFSPEIQEIRVPLPFLQDFHIVDTPGVNSVAAGHEMITEQFLPRADAVLFALPVTNPWGAKCWEFLGRIHHQLGKRVVIVLTQIDLRTEMEVAAILEHLQLCVKQHLGREIPIFPVSAREALLSKTSGIGKQELLHQSRFQPLESYLNTILTETDMRREKLSNTLRMSQILLGNIQQKVGDGAARLNKLGEALRRIASEVQAQKERTWKDSLDLLPELTKSLSLAGDSVPAAAEPRVGEAWTAALQQGLAEQCAVLPARVEKDLRKLWRSTRVTLDVALGRRVDEPTSFTPEIESLCAAHTTMLAPLQEGTTWKQALEPILSAAATRRCRCWLAFVVGAAAVVVGLFTAYDAVAWAGLGLLVVAMLALRLVTGRAARKFAVAWKTMASNEAGRAATAAERALQDWLQRSFSGFSTNFKPLLEACELARTQQEATHAEVVAAGQNFAELSRALLQP